MAYSNNGNIVLLVVIDGEMEMVTDLSVIEQVIKTNIEKVGLDPKTYLEKRMAYYKKSSDHLKLLKIFMERI